MKAALTLSVIFTVVANSPSTCECWKSNVLRPALPFTIVLRIIPLVLSVSSTLPLTVYVPIAPVSPINKVVKEAFPDVIVNELV